MCYNNIIIIHANHEQKLTWYLKLVYTAWLEILELHGLVLNYKRYIVGRRSHRGWTADSKKCFTVSGCGTGNIIVVSDILQHNIMARNNY